MSDTTSTIEMQMQARAALTRAADLIADPDRWCQWYYALNAAGEDATWGWRESAVKWSAFGAVEHEMQCETPKRRYAHACMYAASKELYPHRNGAPEVDEVNMLEGHAAAVALLRRAAEIAADPDSPRVLNPLREVVVLPATAVPA